MLREQLNDDASERSHGPVDGCAHDLRALRETDCPPCRPTPPYVFADLRYRGTGYFIPRRKPVGGQLTNQQREYNERDQRDPSTD